MTRAPDAEAWGRVDLHLHSRASNTTDYYAANLLALPESYSEPLALYRRLKQRGMSLVTLTDHNTMDGVLELLDQGLTDVFTGCEFTATFPEDGCNCHITVINLTQAQFGELNRLRGNVYEMVAYLQAEVAAEAWETDHQSDRQPARNPIAWFVTHPLMSTQNRPYGREGGLALSHIERLALLCPALEVRNGTRTRALNEATEQLVRALDGETLMRLAERHRIAPVPGPGVGGGCRAEVAGSDDHAGLAAGETWTEFPLAEPASPRVDDLIRAIRAGRTRAGGAHGGPITLAHAVMKLIYDHQAQPCAPSKKGPLHLGPSLGLLLRLAFAPQAVGLGARLRLKARTLFTPRSGRTPAARTFDQVLESEAVAVTRDRGFLRHLASLPRKDDQIFGLINRLLNRICAHYIASIQTADSLDLVRTIKEGVALASSNLFVSLPYLVAHFQQSSDRLLVADCRRAFGLEGQERLVLVTDTLFEINGVARTIRRMMAEAERRGIVLTVVACGGAEERIQCSGEPELSRALSSGRLHLLPSVAALGLPQYAGMRLRVPALLELLRFVQEQGFTRMQISTPGPVGLAGLMAAKILQIPTASTYHTSFPEYVENYTGDKGLEALAWRLMILFYHSVDEVVVPSRFIARQLHQRGLRNRKLLILDRWVDLDRFNPGLRQADYWSRFTPPSAATWGIEGGHPPVRFLYVGRVAVEKDLHILAEAYRRLHAAHSWVALVIVGDGPYRAELAERLNGLPVTFTGFLTGEALVRAYASADVFVFPSTTDTWGNAPLEAQACGLPVIVTDKGGPQELMEHGVTGLRVRGWDAGDLMRAMDALLEPDLRRRMGVSARAFVEAHRMNAPYSAILDPEGYRARLREAKRKGRAGMPEVADVALEEVMVN